MISHTTFKDFQENATIICGYPKSGTTLLLALLDNHKQLAVVPEETGFLNRVYGKDRPIERVLGQPPFRSVRRGRVSSVGVGGAGKRDYSRVDYPRMEGFFMDAAASASGYKGIFLCAIEAWYQVQARQSQVMSRWVEKTPGNERHIYILNKWFGEKAIYVFVVRDPRDNFYSLRKRRGPKGLPLDTYARDWAFSCEIALWAQSRFSNFHVLKYEDLCRFPENTMRNLAQRLGIEFVETLLFPSRNGIPWKGNSVLGQEFDGVSASSLGKYQQLLTQEEIAALEAELIPYLRAFSYPMPQNDRPSGQTAAERWAQRSMLHFHFRGRLPRLYQAAQRVRAVLP